MNSSEKTEPLVSTVIEYHGHTVCNDCGACMNYQRSSVRFLPCFVCDEKRKDTVNRIRVRPTIRYTINHPEHSSVHVVRVSTCDVKYAMVDGKVRPIEPETQKK